MKNEAVKIDPQKGNGVLPCVSGRLSSIKQGDKLLIKDNRDCEIDNCVDIYEVTKEDEKSFLAGSTVCGWWFYKDTLQPYSGDATIIGILNDR